MFYMDYVEWEGVLVNAFGIQDGGMFLTVQYI